MNNSQGFWSLLLGADTYSTRRAKWFYEKAESLFNITIKLIILLGIIFLIFSFVMDPYIGIYQLLIDVVLVFILIVFVIFNKLLFMAVGGLIRIGEILENNSTNIAGAQRPSTAMPSSSQKNNVITPNSQTTPVEQANRSPSNASGLDTVVQSADKPGDPEREKFEALRIEATRKITREGHSISMQGTYPMNRWEISYRNGTTKRVSNIEELVAAALELKA